MVYIQTVEELAILFPCLQETLFLRAYLKTRPGVSSRAQKGTLAIFASLQAVQLNSWSAASCSHDLKSAPPLYRIGHTSAQCSQAHFPT